MRMAIKFIHIAYNSVLVYHPTSENHNNVARRQHSVIGGLFIVLMAPWQFEVSPAVTRVYHQQMAPF